MDRKKIGLALIIVGLISYIPTFFIIQHGNINLLSYGPEAPAGIGGHVILPNGSYAPDGIVVTVTNLNTKNVEVGVTENGWYAIGIASHDKDRIKVTCEYNGMRGVNYTTVDFSRATQWCNITIGEQNHNKADWWLLLIPTIVTISGVIERKRR